MELDRLKRKRAAFKSSTTKLLKRIDESKDSVDSSELDDLLNLLQGKIDNIKILDDQIVDLIDVNDIEAKIERSEEYYEKLITNRCMLQRKINDLSLGSQNAQNPVHQNQVSFQSQSFSDPTPAIKLPRLSLNKFYGDPSTYLEFYGQFENAIHKNNSLSKVEKLIYLKSLVGGGAASAIKCLELKR
ncbi:uncharacterized protein TNCT_455351 [Trichonephila clavata]|uniref:Uncharacterized protein n=1 Tax=Trichonephila clavata TaxID=2740835 RepID=A0A8X6KI18_TRICU|nr:uncharacterized protein TNCT_455351 [Trichonephila clavata]